jgi:hypothetical protein
MTELHIEKIWASQKQSIVSVFIAVFLFLGRFKASSG